MFAQGRQAGRPPLYKRIHSLMTRDTIQPPIQLELLRRNAIDSAVVSGVTFIARRRSSFAGCRGA